MSESSNILSPKNFPPLLHEINDPPKQLYYRGLPPNFDEYILLCVVGSRKISDYGKMVCRTLIEGLRGTNVIIVSGLALGTDTCAHENALEAGLKTIAIPGSGIDDKTIYPKSNFHLANKILKHGGLLLSEYEDGFKATQWSFPRRNRVMAGMCHATLIVEAGEKSGTLITARLAMEYNRDVMAVPGSIFSANTKGSHELIKNGATPIASVEDLREALGIATNIEQDTTEIVDCNDEEKAVLRALATDSLDKTMLVEKTGQDITTLNMTITMLEIKGYIEERGGKIHRVR